jgi:hypothetical protein
MQHTEFLTPDLSIFVIIHIDRHTPISTQLLYINSQNITKY